MLGTPRAAAHSTDHSPEFTKADDDDAADDKKGSRPWRRGWVVGRGRVCCVALSPCTCALCVCPSNKTIFANVCALVSHERLCSSLSRSSRTQPEPVLDVFEHTFLFIRPRAHKKTRRNGFNVHMKIKQTERRSPRIHNGAHTQTHQRTHPPR